MTVCETSRFATSKLKCELQQLPLRSDGGDDVTNRLDDEFGPIEVNHMSASLRLDQLAGAGERRQLELLRVPGLVAILRALDDDQRQIAKRVAGAGALPPQGSELLTPRLGRLDPPGQ